MLAPEQLINTEQSHYNMQRKRFQEAEDKQVREILGCPLPTKKEDDDRGAVVYYGS